LIPFGGAELGVLVSVAGMTALGLATAPVSHAETAPALHNASTTVVASSGLQSPTAVHIAMPVSPTMPTPSTRDRPTVARAARATTTLRVTTRRVV